MSSPRQASGTHAANQHCLPGARRRCRRGHRLRPRQLLCSRAQTPAGTLAATAMSPSAARTHRSPSRCSASLCGRPAGLRALSRKMCGRTKPCFPTARQDTFCTTSDKDRVPVASATKNLVGHVALELETVQGETAIGTLWNRIQTNQAVHGAKWATMPLKGTKRSCLRRKQRYCYTHARNIS